VRGASTKDVQTAKDLSGKDRDDGIDEDDDDKDEEDAVPVGAMPLSLAEARGHEDVAALLQLHDETRHLGLREHEQLATFSVYGQRNQEEQYRRLSLLTVLPLIDFVAAVLTLANLATLQTFRDTLPMKR